MNPFRIVAADAPGTDLGGWADDGNVDVVGNLLVRGALDVDGIISGLGALTGEAASSLVLSAKRAGDAAARWTVLADGTMAWGGGTLATDVSMYRYAAGGLAISAAALRLDSSNLLMNIAGDASLVGVRSGVVGTPNDFELTTVGKGLNVKEGANARMGRATLIGGTLVVATTAVTAASEIFLTCQVPGGAPGFLRVSARVAATSFTILSSSGTDTSDVGWLIMEPSA